MSSSITPTPVPTGGAITLQIESDGIMTLSRAVSGVGGLSAFTTLYAGITTPFFVDVGDGLPGPLNSGTLYVYQLDDDNGQLQTDPVMPALRFDPQIEPLTAMLIKLLQGAVNTMVLPAGVRKTGVLQAMPIGGIPAMPFITINLDLIQQEQIPIGQSVPIYNLIAGQGVATITGFVHRSFKISVLSDNATERDFYRDALPGVFEVFAAFVLAPAGLNVEHKYQAASGQVAKDTIGKGPGFYFADVLLAFSGSFNITVTTDYGLVGTLDFVATSSGGAETEVIVPHA